MYQKRFENEVALRDKRHQKLISRKAHILATLSCGEDVPDDDINELITDFVRGGWVVLAKKFIHFVELIKEDLNEES